LHGPRAPRNGQPGTGAAYPPRIPLNRARISQSALPLTRLAGELAKSGPVPVPVQGVAMISLLLADGMGPLYHDARGDDLGDIIGRATRALSLISPRSSLPELDGDGADART
jgi:hypothetical protein